MTEPNEFEALSPNFKRALMEKAQSVHPFWNLLGMELADVRKGWAVIRMPFEKKLTHADGIAHGGAIFSAADAAVAMALIGLIERNETMVTIEMKLNYLKPFKKGMLYAEARIVQKGSRTALGEVDVTLESGAKIAKGLATYMVLPKARSGADGS